MFFMLYVQTDDNIDSPADSRRSSEQVYLIIEAIKLFIVLLNIRFFILS